MVNLGMLRVFCGGSMSGGSKDGGGLGVSCWSGCTC